jgi:hypothetical protein
VGILEFSAGAGDSAQQDRGPPVSRSDCTCAHRRPPNVGSGLLSILGNFVDIEMLLKFIVNMLTPNDPLRFGDLRFHQLRVGICFEVSN